MTNTHAPAPTSKRSGDDHGDGGLPVGTRLGEFEITHRIGEGGFSVVYLAWDHSLDRRIALKEYMPSSIAVRGGHTQVHPRSERHRDTYDAGLRSFINEAKLLAQFDHPALVKVYRFWEANGTAYMVMPFYQGSTVRDTVRQMPGPPDEAWMRSLLLPLAEALKVIHDVQCFHRDVAPDNVILLADTGQPLLLDFGAARRVVAGMTQALTVILKPGYAPIEQYDEIPGMKQGPWTDVYALAAVVHWLITSRTPPASVGRLLNDTYVPLVQAAAGRYSERFLAATDRALTVLPDKRTPSIQAFLADLGLAGPGSGAPLEMPPVPEDDEVTIIKPRTVTRAPMQAMQPPAQAQATLEPVTSAASRGPVIGGAIAALVIAVAAGGWWFMRSQSPAPTPPVEQAPAPQNAPLPVTAGAGGPDPEAARASEPLVQMPTPSPSPAPAVASPPPVTAPAPAPVAAASKPRAAPKLPPTAPANAAECASVLQRLSLGESSPELIDRVKTLGCR